MLMVVRSCGGACGSDSPLRLEGEGVGMLPL